MAFDSFVSLLISFFSSHDVLAVDPSSSSQSYSMISQFVIPRKFFFLLIDYFEVQKLFCIERDKLNQKPKSFSL